MAKKNNLYTQYISDKVKEARLNGEAWLNYRGKRLKIVPWTEENDRLYEKNNAINVIIKTHSRLEYANILNTGRILFTPFKKLGRRGFGSYINLKNIRAIVVEIHDRENKEPWQIFLA